MDKKKILIIGGIAVVLFILLLNSFTIVQPTEVGYVVTLGNMAEQRQNSGLVFHLPFISYVQTVDSKIVKIEENGQAASKDLQIVTYKVAVSYHVETDNARTLILTLGDMSQINDKIVLPAVMETQKAMTSKYNAEEIITKREELKQKIDEDLMVRLAKYNVVLNEVSIVNVDFSPEYNTAIEQKQVAQQNALKAEYEKQQATIDAQKVVIQAQAQATAQQLLQSSLTNEIVSKMWIEKWNGVLPTTMTGTSGIILPLK